MAPSAIYSSSIDNSPGGKSAVLLKATSELISEQTYKPVKSVPFVEITRLPEDSGSSSESSPVDDSAKPLVTVHPDLPPQLSGVVSSMSQPMSGAKKLRKMLLETDELIVCPGVYDGLSARTAIELGFDAMYMVRLRSTCKFVRQLPSRLLI